MSKLAVACAIGPDRASPLGVSAGTNSCNGATSPACNSKEISPECESGMSQPSAPVLYHAPYQHTHVGTDVFAEVLFVEAKTVLKSHSLNGHYVGIRPVRLPNRKLAWPIAEIRKLFDMNMNTASVKEAA